MESITGKWGRLNPIRHVVQALSFLFLNPLFYRMFTSRGYFQLKEMCVPVMNCWSCPWAVYSCPVGAIGKACADGYWPFLLIGGIIFFGVIIGRLLCGWFCPFGFLQELLYKIPSRKITMPQPLRWGKYVFLFVFTILIALVLGNDPSTGLPGSVLFFCNWCPAGTLEAALPVHFFNENLSFSKKFGMFLISWRVWILVAFLISFVYIHRFFCRAVCPIAAMLGIFNRISFFSMSRSRGNCGECRSCKDACPVDEEIFPGDESDECIRCLHCQDNPCRTEEFVIELKRSDWCKQCKICYELCPEGVFEWDKVAGRPVVSKPEFCTGCKQCEERCPDFVILVKSKGAKEKPNDYEAPHTADMTDNPGETEAVKKENQ
ncbi:MAG: 4Fe-4S binding protein [Planctomycetota bacterium]|jgi:NAD-dependent dihydropyrimidine dehydrogenase PreA subunit